MQVKVEIFNTILPPSNSSLNSWPDLPNALQKLSINTTSSTKNKPQQQPPTDSWDALSSDDDEHDEEADALTALPSSKRKDLEDYPSAPPPTPMSAHISSFSQPAALQDFTASSSPPSSTSRISSSAAPRRIASSNPDVRPEKTTSSAARMIAGALGVKAPKKTEEQRMYEKAVREKEVRRRDREKEEKKREEEEKEKARRSVWDDWSEGYCAELLNYSEREKHRTVVMIHDFKRLRKLQAAVWKGHIVGE